MDKKIIIAIVAVVVLVAGYFVWQNSHKTVTLEVPAVSLSK